MINEIKYQSDTLKKKDYIRYIVQWALYYFENVYNFNYLFK